MVNRNLLPGQYQIGDFVFGAHTMYPVESFDIGAYDVNVQDFQTPTSDSIRFGRDTLKPMPIQITINAMKNFILPNIAGLVNNTKELNFENDHRPGRFAKEWRADAVRSQWGELKPLYICREEDGRVVRVYGRPGKLAVPPLKHRGTNQQILAEYRRSDTLCYSDIEWFVQSRPNEIVKLTRSEDFDMGNAPCWLRILLVGPMTHPIIQIGSVTVELDEIIELGEVVEISSYPWQQRVIRLNDGVSLSAKLTRPYLDKLQLNIESGVELSWNATNINQSSTPNDFSGYSNGAIPSGTWWVDTDPDGGAGTMTVVNGKIVWTDSGAKEHYISAIHKTPTVTEYQYVEMKVSEPAEWTISAGTQPINRIIGNSNASRTEYNFWDITHNYAWYGYRKNGTDYRVSKIFTIKDIATVLRRFWGENSINLEPQNNWIYGAEFAGQSAPSVLRINGYIAAHYEGGQGVSGLDHRHTGIAMKAMPVLGVGQATPGPVAYLNFRDNTPPEVAESLNLSAVLLMWRNAWQTI